MKCECKKCQGIIDPCNEEQWGPNDCLINRQIELVNLTPHDIVVIYGDKKKKVFPKSGSVARVSVEYYFTELGEVIGVPTTSSSYGQVIGLFKEFPGVYYIVSTMVAQAMQGKRFDLLSPGPLIRDESGQPVGCSSLNMI